MFENNSETGLEYIEGLSHSGKPVKDLSRIKKLLALLGDPQEKLRFVHIAGTNGKGSMAQMFNGIFVHAGLKTGLFTSPYIFEFGDRIRVNGENIPSQAISRLASAVKAAADDMNEREDLSQFEVTTAIAMLYFLEMKCDIVVLETGLGGLLDCTNAVQTSILTVIGSVDFDHTAILGNTLELIAEQKAGIMKTGVPCVLNGFNCDSVKKVFEEKAETLGCELVMSEPNEIKVRSEGVFGTEFDYKGTHFSTSMGGSFQVANAVTVIEGSRLLAGQFGFSDEDIREGIKNAKVPARAQALCEAPLTILDGGHNPDAMRALAGVLGQVCTGGRKCHAVIGMCADKNIASAIEAIVSQIESFVTVDGFSPRAQDKHELARMIEDMGGQARAASSDIQTEIAALQKQYPDDVILICGSLYLAAEVGRYETGRL